MNFESFDPVSAVVNFTVKSGNREWSAADRGWVFDEDIEFLSSWIRGNSDFDFGVAGFVRIQIGNEAEVAGLVRIQFAQYDRKRPRNPLVDQPISTVAHFQSTDKKTRFSYIVVFVISDSPSLSAAKF